MTKTNEPARLAPAPIIAGRASGHLLREVALPTSEGEVVRLSDYRQRKNLVLFLHHGAACAACRHMLQVLAERVPAYADQETVVLAIGPDTPAATARLACEIGAPAMRFLSDPAQRGVTRQDLAVPALVIADRFGEIWAAWAGGPEHALPEIGEVSEWLEFIEIQCPECEAPEWSTA